MFARVVVFALVCFTNVDSAVLKSKGLFCRDPDTGKLHPINATWASTSFCGNYTCKLRKVNQTLVQEPIRVFNITDINFKQEKVNNETIQNSVESKNSDFELRTEIPMFKKEHIKLDDDDNGDDDRYLTEAEINSIASVLHKVKKSDIDALVEVYTLAQEIYHEMDRVTDQEAVDESVNNLKERIQYLDAKNSQSRNDKPRDMEAQSTSTSSLYRTNKLKKENVENSKNPTYFSGPLTKKDFGKIPYYYPISAFQRMSSYVHHPTQKLKASAGTPINNNILKDQKIQYPVAYVETKESEKLIKPSYLLPYPFSYVNKYNMSKYANMYANSPWVWDYYYRNRQTPYLKAYVAHITPYTGAMLLNPHLNEENVQDIEQPIKKTENKNVKNEEPWKTKPLSTKIINEIKANIDPQRIKKAFPLRKKVKIEKVGKLIKMDELARSRRDITNIFENGEMKETVNAKQGMQQYKPIALDAGEYEAVIEKITCQPQTVPGYFRYGNLSEPYPRCCPQLIHSR